jgi:hypothetical protein
LIQLLANSGSEGSEKLTLNQGSLSSLEGQVKEVGKGVEYENLESTKNYSSSKFNSPEMNSPTALVNCNTNASDTHFNHFQMHESREASD